MTGAGEQWQDIASAPKDGTPILVYHPSGWIGIATLRLNSEHEGVQFISDNHAWYGHRRGEKWPTIWMGGDRATEATHWRALPAPPPQGARP